MFAGHMIGVYAILFTALLGAPASAQSRPQDYNGALTRVCRAEINAHCKGVQDARGQLMACLYGHQPQLSARCEGVLLGSIERLGTVLGKVKTVLRDCDRDSRLYRKDVVAGNGNLVACFLLGNQMVSAQCKGTVYSIWDKKGFRG